MEQPIRLTPSLRERVWGRTRLAPWFPDSETAIGEAWLGVHPGASRAVRVGEAWLLPDEGEQAAMVAREASRFLRTWVPG